MTLITVLHSLQQAWSKAHRDDESTETSPLTVANPQHAQQRFSVVILFVFSLFSLLLFDFSDIVPCCSVVQILKAILCLHSFGIVHRTVKKQAVNVCTAIGMPRYAAVVEGCS